MAGTNSATVNERERRRTVKTSAFIVMVSGGIEDGGKSDELVLTMCVERSVIVRSPDEVYMP